MTAGSPQYQRTNAWRENEQQRKIECWKGGAIGLFMLGKASVRSLPARGSFDSDPSLFPCRLQFCQPYILHSTLEIQDQLKM
jgi:hypothetical protein